jgi:septal ring factor EnvC (AmiA/AmiB activator)
MIIEQTNIPDVTEENIDKSKLTLADNVITNVYPLFDEIYQDRIDSLSSIRSEYKKKKTQVKESKENLEGLMLHLERVKKESKLLVRIEKLINSGLANDGNLKHENVILLKIYNKLSNEKLEYHLRNTLKIISKRFSR